MEEKNYLQQKKMWIRFLKKIIKNKKIEQNCYRKYFEPGKVKDLKLNVLKEFENVLPDVPYIGTLRENPFLVFLVFTVMSLCFYRVLKKEGWGGDAIGRVLYEIADNYYGSMNIIQKKLVKWYMGSSILRGRLRRAEEWQSRNRNPWNYEARFIPGDGGNLLFGYDYTECGGLKFLKAQHAEELAPYLCLSDYAMSRALGIGFERTGNLALGAGRCDFRFYRHFATPSGWPPDDLDEYKHFSMQKK